MNLFKFVILVAFCSSLSTAAQAWTVNCGEKTLYYSSGSILKSSSGSFYFRNGSLMISTSGSVYYESGSLLKSSSGSIYYSSGSLLRSTSSSFYYPSGSLARSSSGTTYSENGSVSNFPVTLRDRLSDEIPVAVHASPSFGGIDIRFAISSGSASEELDVVISEDRVDCEFLGTPNTEFTLSSDFADVRVKVRPGHDPDRVRRALQKALDDL